jgi:hypothetical protein
MQAFAPLDLCQVILTNIRLGWSGTNNLAYTSGSAATKKNGVIMLAHQLQVFFKEFEE